MVRAVKTKPQRALAKGQRALVLPGATAAEPWEVWIYGGKSEAEMVQVVQTPGDNRLRRSATLALPITSVYCLPLWLNQTDPRQFAEMIPLQLELRGLQPRNEPPIFDYSVVAQVGERTLLLVGVLPATLSADLHAEAYESFELSARCYAFAKNSLTLFREQDRLLLAITRGTNLAYFQTLSDGEITGRTVQDIRCAQNALVMQDILEPIEQVVLWTAVKPAEREALEAAFEVPVKQADQPTPALPAQAWRLTPSSVGAARRARESQRWFRRGAVALFVLYLAFVGWIVYRYIAVSLQVAELRRWQAAHSAQLDAVESGRAMWKELGPVVDYPHYPLELLRQAQQCIPPGLNLTLFESSAEGHLLMKGEAKNVAAAFQFLTKLKADPFFTGYNLDMGNPRPLPNDLAQFQIEGARANQ
jgi:hypothetical protein